MALITAAIAAVGLGLSAYGAYQNYQGQKEANASAQQQLAIQQQQEAERKKAMELDAARRTREIIRQNVAARSLSLATVTNQGAEFGSALPGAYGGESGRSGVNALGVSQNLEIGNTMFGLNSQLTDARSSYLNAQSRSALGSSLMGFGGAIVNNLGMINRVGNYVSSYFNPAPYTNTNFTNSYSGSSSNAIY